jgi:hypothetical protein
LKSQRGSLWMGGGWWLGRSVGWLAGWLVGASERTRPLVKVPFTLMTKNRTSLNGTDEWLWKQHLICIEGASLSTLAESRSARLLRLSLFLSLSLSFPPLAALFRPFRWSRSLKRALSFFFLSIIAFDRIFYSDRASRVPRPRRSRASLPPSLPPSLPLSPSLYDCPSPPIVTARETTRRTQGRLRKPDSTSEEHSN